VKLGQLADDVPSMRELDITPLIDIVFILLIFFVVTTTFVHDVGLDLERPEASAANEQPASIVRVAVSERGEVAVNGQPTSPWRLEAEVHDRLIDRAEASILVIADKAVHADSLVAIMDACRRGGAEKIALAVEVVTGP